MTSLYPAPPEPLILKIAATIAAHHRYTPVFFLISEDRRIFFDLLSCPVRCLEIQRRRDNRWEPCRYNESEMNLADLNVKEPSLRELSGTIKWNNSEKKSPPCRNFYHYVPDFFSLSESQRLSCIPSFLRYLEQEKKFQGERETTENLFLISPVLPPREILIGVEQYVEVIRVPLPGLREISDILLEKQNRRLEMNCLSPVTPEEYWKRPDSYLEMFRGLSRRQIYLVLSELEAHHAWYTDAGLSEKRKSQFERKCFVEEAKTLIYRQKRQITLQDNVLQFLPEEPRPKPGGLDGLLAWVEEKKKILDEPEAARQYGETFPKGVLIVGLPGSGKSMMAKYIAYAWNVPLIQFRFSQILTGVLGGTEERMNRALKMIENVSPCVVWIDEIEKELNGMQGRGNSDGGVGSRCLAMLLNWMQETQSERNIFICATANQIQLLPMELLRRGRFDRKFYTFLPTHEQCVEIMTDTLQTVADTTPGLFEKSLTKRFPTLANEVFQEISHFDGKFFTGADIAGLIQDARSLLFQRREVLPYNESVMRDALIQCADWSQPFGETNMDAILDYWLSLRQHSFVHAAYNVSSGGDRRHAILLDFSDLSYDGIHWAWKPGLTCPSDYAYDRKLFSSLKKGIQNAINRRNFKSYS